MGRHGRGPPVARPGACTGRGRASRYRRVGVSATGHDPGLRGTGRPARCTWSAPTSSTSSTSRWRRWSTRSSPRWPRGSGSTSQTLSEFLVVVGDAHRAQVARLLPGARRVEPDEELVGWEERDLLLARLLECQAYAAAADGFASSSSRRPASVPRDVGLDDDLVVLAPDLLEGVTADELAAAFLRATAERPAPRRRPRPRHRRHGHRRRSGRASSRRACPRRGPTHLPRADRAPDRPDRDHRPLPRAARALQAGPGLARPGPHLRRARGGLGAEGRPLAGVPTAASSRRVRGLTWPLAGGPGDRGRADRRRRAGSAAGCWPSCSSCRSSGSSRSATSWRRVVPARGPRLRGGADRRRLPHPDATRTWRPTSSASPTAGSRPGCRPPRSRRWRSWRTSSRSRGAQISALRGVNVDGVVRLLEHRGYIERGRTGRGPGPGRPLRDDRRFPRAARARPARPAAAGGGPAARARGPRRARGAAAPGAAMAMSRARRAADRRTAAEGPGPGRRRLPPGLRGADRRRAGSRSTARCRSSGAGSTRRSTWSSSTACPLSARAGPRPLPAEQAGRRRLDRRGHPRPRRPWSPSSLAEPRVFPVGRLDRETEGLLAPHQRRRAHPPAHPPFLRRGEGVPRRRSRASRRPATLRRLREGVELDDGPTAPAKVAASHRASCASSSTRGATARSAGCATRSATRSVRLVRTRIGPIADPTLAPGRVPATSRTDEVRSPRRRDRPSAGQASSRQAGRRKTPE